MTDKEMLGKCLETIKQYNNSMTYTEYVKAQGAMLQIQRELEEHTSAKEFENGHKGYTKDFGFP